MFRRFTSLFFLQVIIMATMMVCASPAPAPFAFDQYARGMSDDVASRGIFSSFKKHMKKLSVDDFKKAIGVVGEGMNKVNSAINSRGLDEPLPRGFFDDLKGAINVVDQGLDVVNSAVNQRDLHQRWGPAEALPRGIFSSLKKRMKKLNVDDFKKAIGVVGEGMNKVNSAINSRGLDEPLPRGFFDDLKGAITMVDEGLAKAKGAIQVVGEGMDKFNKVINSRGLDEPLPRGFFDDLKGAINVVDQGLDVVNSAVNQRDLHERD